MTDLGSDRMTQLAERLLRLTIQQKIKWSEAEGDSYIYAMADASAVIRNVDNDGRHPYALELYDKSGDIVDSLTTAYPRANHSVPPYNDLVMNLFVMARRSAHNVDEVINNFMAALPEPDEDDLAW